MFWNEGRNECGGDKMRRHCKPCTDGGIEFGFGDE